MLTYETYKVTKQISLYLRYQNLSARTAVLIHIDLLTSASHPHELIGVPAANEGKAVDPGGSIAVVFGIGVCRG